MMIPDLLEAFLLRCLLINLVLYTLTAVLIMTCREWVVHLQARMFSLEPDHVRRTLYHYLADYKLLFLVFNFVPWLALWMMG